MANRKKRRKQMRKGDMRLLVAGGTALVVLILIYAMAG